MDSVLETTNHANKLDSMLDTTLLIEEIQELEARLKLPLSLDLPRTALGQSLAADAWRLRTSKKSPFAKLPFVPSYSVYANNTAMRSQIALMDEFRQAAKRKVKRISAKERARILDSVQIHSFAELLRQHLRTTAKDDGVNGSDSDATTEMEGRAGASAIDSDTENGEDEDDLMRLVRRQRAAFSARAAAGRPSIRQQHIRDTPNLRRPSHQQSLPAPGSVSVNNAALSKSERLYRTLVKKYVGKAGRARLTIRRDKMLMAKKAARDCAKAVRLRQTAQKPSKDSTYRARRLAREIAAYWCVKTGGCSVASDPSLLGLNLEGANASSSSAGGGGGGVGAASRYLLDREGDHEGGVVDESSAAARRRLERAMAEQRKADLELLEARRQQRKLNFLLTQTELYTHFMAKKMDGGGGDAEVESILYRLQVDNNGAGTAPPNMSLAEAAKAAAGRLGISDDADGFDAETLKAQALSRVQAVVEKENKNRNDFGGHRKPISRHEAGRDGESTATVQFDVSKPPTIFKGDLKAYQLKGLAWLLTLFDQGINGILADEMGLGKTVQTIAFMGSLAENYNLWGPFLIVTPASTLYNWTQEFTKFMPAFRIVPYWGSPAERKILRRFWSPSTEGGGTLLGTEQGAFHVVVTSYQVVLQDAKFINKTAWTYIVLDEAHAIKSTSSLRWRLLLSFKCRNRLLLTGTPIQNAMRELWALLHFIMPALFDSHDEFADWFSKDIESQAASGGGVGEGGSAGPSAGGRSAVTTLNEQQLSRLRLILKPFMLRRVKAEVEHEISDKTEVLIYCHLTSRQNHLYNRLKSKIRIEDLNTDSILEQQQSSGSNRLMNLVMQLRKVCNHPDLFDRRDVGFSTTSVTPFAAFGGLWWIPKLLFDEGLVCGQTWRRHDDKMRIITVRNLFLLTAAYFMQSYWHEADHLRPPGRDDRVSMELMHFEKCFSVARLFGCPPSALSQPPPPPHRPVEPFTPTPPRSQSGFLDIRDSLPVATNPCFPILPSGSGFLFRADCMVLPLRRQANSPALEVDPQNDEKSRVVELLETHPPFVYSAAMLPAFVRPLRLFACRPNSLLDTQRDISIDWSGDLCCTAHPLPAPPSLELVSPGYLIADSGKLKELDRLLTKLKPDSHRVLIYSQMTKMINLLEELMLYRGHTYLRLDGSSRLSDRRDMVAQWQTDPRWFVFLLSTRAGGLGINLTAADTVIFYDSDWNPTVDQQAMDRAHRLGQLKAIIVYRLISKGTVEGRMLQRAEEKRAMQRMVIAGDSSTNNNLGTSSNTATDSFLQRERDDRSKMSQSDMVSLLLDDEELAMRLAQRKRTAPSRGRPTASTLKKSADHSASRLVNPAVTQPSVESILNRKRMAAWAERSRGGGRGKKPRASELQQPASSNVH